MSAIRAVVRCTVSAISNTFKSRNTGFPYFRTIRTIAGPSLAKSSNPIFITPTDSWT